MNKKIKITEVLGIIVFLSGSVVMMGWIFDIDILKSILPVWVTMKFSTALCFSLSGITMCFIASSQEKGLGIAQVVLPITTLGILLFMATLLISVFIGVRTGVEDLFVREVVGTVKTTTPGRPSVGTMINFILVATAGILTMLNITRLKVKLLAIGGIVAVIGGVAIIGYIFSVPVFYYTIEGFSTAMAFHTAILFVLLGTGLILLKGKDNVN
jgi:hypothetical protein